MKARRLTKHFWLSKVADMGRAGLLRLWGLGLRSLWVEGFSRYSEMSLKELISSGLERWMSC